MGMRRVTAFTVVATVTAAVACKLTGTGGVAGVADSGGADGESCSGGRYEILDRGNESQSYTHDCPKAGSGCDGSGLVKDTKTGFEWLRFEYFPGEPQGQNQAEAATYCTNRAMRLPTEDEALAIAGDNTERCVWQPYWATWPSNSPESGRALAVRSDGSTVDLDVDKDSAPALCVR